jgi:hypothetical protein
MKLLDTQLLASVGTTYDQTRTTLQGNVYQKTFNGVQVLGAPVTRFIDVVTETGIAPNGFSFCTPNNRLFIVGAALGTVAGVAQQHPIMLYNFNPATGASSYVGRIVVQLPISTTTAHAFRAIKVIDGVGTTGWKIYLTTSQVFGQSGQFLVNNIDQADFTPGPSPVPIQYPIAAGSNQKAVYFLGQFSPTVNFSGTVTLGSPTTNPVTFNVPGHVFVNGDQVFISSVVGTFTGTGAPAVNTRYFVINAGSGVFQLSATFGGAGLAATAVPTSVIINQVNTELEPAASILDTATNRLYTHTGLSAAHQYFVRDTSVTPVYSADSGVVITAAAPGKVQITGHNYKANDAVMLLSGVIPGGLVLNTVYFVTNPTANDFELSATAGGTGITTTTAGNVTIGRAWGYTNSQWLHKTNILPALAGVILLTDTENQATPVAAPVNGAVLNGNSCAFLATTTTMYLGLLSELTAGATTWPSLTASNYLGATGQYTIPATVANASWSNTLDQAIVALNTVKFLTKKVINNQIDTVFGQMGIRQYEAVNPQGVEMEFLSAPLGFSNYFGWLFAVGPAAAQRGIIAMDLKSDITCETSYIVTKVLNFVPTTTIKLLKATVENEDPGSQLAVFYRTSGFGSISGGWTAIDPNDLLALGSVSQIQFKLGVKLTSIGKSSPLQIAGFQIGYDTLEELSDNWEYSYDDSSVGTPTRCGFRLKAAYASAVPSSLTFRAFDLSNTQLVSQSITSNPGNFQYSTDNGSTWLSLGVVPNVVGTLIRYTFTSPPGVDIRPSLKDS